MSERDHSLPSASLLITHAAQVLTCTPVGRDLAGSIPDGAVAVAGEHILTVGTTAEVLEQVDASRARLIDAHGKILAPGFVDSHTHLVFGGSRVQEYAARLTRSASEVRTLGIPTGIQASVVMTREAPSEQLTASGLQRLDDMLRHGTTTVESKSGYGLSVETERKMLEVNRVLQKNHPIDMVSTFLGAHAVPQEMGRRRYVDLVIEKMIPEVAEAGLAEFCDVYCDDGYFTVQDSRLILEAAREAGLKMKIHTDQYSDLGGGRLAADLGVVSADHLNYTDRKTMRRLAESGVTGVVMPLIDFAVRHPRPFDPRAMLSEGMSLALATDLCPGCYAVSIPLAIQFACRQNGLSPAEALHAATAGGARALALDDRGVLAPGKLADLQIWDLPTLEDLVYRLGHNAVEMVVKRGKVIYERPLMGSPRDEPGPP